MAKSNFSKVDEYGFQEPENFNYRSYDEFRSKYVGILTRRAVRWSAVIRDNYQVRNNTLKRFIRKGIPFDKRPMVWMTVSGAQKLKENCDSYMSLKGRIKNKGLIDTIKIDLPRTFPDNIYFTNEDFLSQQLFGVLATFAHQNAEVGYCQGLNYIAGLLLLATKNEECSFWLLKVLVEELLPQYYISSMSGLLTDLDVLDELILKVEPQVHHHIHRIGMPWAMGTTKWFICLFSEVLPTETVLRIWDCLFYEGSKIIFRVAITLIKIHKREILETNELGELIACFRNMKNSQRVIDCHQFMSDVFKLSGSLPRAKLENLRRKHSKTKT